MGCRWGYLAVGRGELSLQLQSEHPTTKATKQSALCKVATDGLPLAREATHGPVRAACMCAGPGSCSSTSLCGFPACGLVRVGPVLGFMITYS